MEQAELIKKLNSYGIEKLTTITRYGTYLTTNRASLVASQVRNRSSADWKKAQFVIINKDGNNGDSLSECLKGWKTLAEKKQYLLIYEDDKWLFYDNEGRSIEFDDMMNNWDDEHTKKCKVCLPSHQTIFYGAPGTGKSHKIKQHLDENNVPKENIFRTTFHPDSDYSTFVGSYKPTRGKRKLYGLNQRETIVFKNEKGEPIEEEVITYNFIPQAFTNAYVRAYQVPDQKVYLVIEEINRGNCAQIFGDLFQLLDRDESGKSDYTIKCDTDLKMFLEEEFEELGVGDDGIKDGELCLPPNLYIFATMNTSDQSLFPIDSAFERRWEWEYEPIKYNVERTIQIGDNKYSWTSFQKIVNKRIYEATSSEDKMMGDYFVNPSHQVITDKLLLNKILFYLWKNVCKDGEGDIFKIKQDGIATPVSFSELHGVDGPDKEKLIQMMELLGVESKDSVADQPQQEVATETSTQTEE